MTTSDVIPLDDARRLVSNARNRRLTDEEADRLIDRLERLTRRRTEVANAKPILEGLAIAILRIVQHLGSVHSGPASPLTQADRRIQDVLDRLDVPEGRR